MIRVLVADDHALIREGLVKIFDGEADIEVVSQAGDGQQAIELARTLRPDVAILDFNMPGATGLEVMQALHRDRPELPVLMLTMYPEEDFAVRVFRAGAAGYLSKQSAADEVVTAVRKVVAGEKYVTPSAAHQLAMELIRPANESPHESLSGREFQVMRLIASGSGTRGIAEELGLSVNTIATYRRRILEKLGLKSDVDITRYALENRLLD